MVQSIEIAAFLLIPELFAVVEPTLMEPAGRLRLGSVEIVDTFAEAFSMIGARLIITAESSRWAEIAAAEMCGNATSVIACDAEAALERPLPAERTPDGRPGVAVLVFAFGRKGLAAALVQRVGQCVLTCATTACYDGLGPVPAEDRVPLARQLRFFGDGFQSSKKFGNRRLWRIPVMDGEFVCEDRVGTRRGVGGGNLLICGENQSAALAAAEAAAEAARTVEGVILPFPGGIVRSGSKVGSRYKQLKASTNDPYCPTLRGRTETHLPPGTEAVYEIVIDGLSADAVRAAMRAALHAAAASPGVTRITAGNYGGKLGPHHFPLRELIE